MAQPIQDTQYLVIEYDKTTKKPKAPRLTSSLTSFRKKLMPFGTDEHFLADALSGRTAGYGLEVREATEEDIQKHGGNTRILSAAQSYNGADEIARLAKLDAAREIIPFIVKSVNTEEDLINAMNTYSLTTTQIMAMAKDVREEGVGVSDAFVDIYCALVASRSKKAGNERSFRQVRAQWDAPRNVAKNKS